MLKLVADNSPQPGSIDPRGALIKKVQVARKSLGIQDDDYRAMMERVTGHRSAKDCNANELRAAISNFERMGFRSAGHRNIGTGHTVRKARAMWISLYQLGAIDDRTDAALEAFGRRQLKVDRLQWANEREGFRLIEALKAMAERNGWSQRVSSRLPGADRIRLLKDRLIGAQLAKLAAAGVTVEGPLAADRAQWSDRKLESAAAELGLMLRDLPKNH